jgi:nicotinic acid mononucleotide adenylyltransferase
MAELAVAGKARLQVYRGESAHLPHVIGTFEAIVREYPDYRFVHILGVDTFVRLDRWQDVQSVVGHATYAVAYRPGTPTQAVTDLKARLGSLADRLEVQRFEFDDHGLASSTEIRRQLAAGEQPASVDPKVYDYVLSHSLYR